MASITHIFRVGRLMIGGLMVGWSVIIRRILSGDGGHRKS